ncbi:uncharacterized protein LOC120644165 isoform X3 [Panicum virgatum]|uniref:uncharacterized protein LOC120644165 isoform X3 n=1 Tax=Panicum virgatum TaxID=38727 RepID=UPI0019D5B906|nr:uncharacterized protein LOC120644165 isoform X3 [Panicum virgatum]
MEKGSRSLQSAPLETIANAGMDSTARIYDMYETMLENILQDPSEPPVSLPLEFLEAITDNFSSDHELGRGGYGVVYKGILRSGKVIAVKKIYDAYSIEKDNSLDEISRVMGIMHPNVVQLIGYCAETKMDTLTHDSGKLIVAERRSRLLCFEYISNGGLHMYISKEHLDLGWDEIYKIIKGICSGLDALHEEKIIHLDLKPQNVLMDGNMEPKIVDFGFARQLGENKSKIYTERATGTVGYIAPEYHFHGKISPKADIFSLGVIMIELITGSRSTPHYSYTSYDNNSLDSTQAHQQFTENVLGKWKKIFQRTLHEASVIQVYTHQLKQLIDIALKCVDIDVNKRPTAADILQFFYQNAAGGSSCDPICKNSQVRDLISVQPIELKFPMADPNKFQRYTIAVTIRNQQNPRPSNDMFFTLESTRASDQEIKNVISRHLTSDHNDFFTKAKDKGRQVHEEKITPVYGNNDQSEIKIVPLEWSSYNWASIDVHPTEPWILLVRRDSSTIIVWDYNTQEMARLPACRDEKVSSLFDPYGHVITPIIAKFVARKKWIIVGCRSGYIKVYSYCEQSLFSETESFKAHEYGEVTSLELHETESYVLSAVSEWDSSVWDNPMDKIKLWHWENGWKLICTFNTDKFIRQVKFNPNDVNIFATTTSGGPIKVWNTSSKDSISEFSGTRHAMYLDFFSRDGALYMIIVKESDRRNPTIWDYQKMKCVATLKGHTHDVNVVFSCPEFRVLITGSNDGSIRLWNSSTFSLVGVLNCGLGRVMAIAWLKKPGRIAILLRDGLAITEIDLGNQLSTSEGPNESEAS